MKKILIMGGNQFVGKEYSKEIFRKRLYNLYFK